MATTTNTRARLLSSADQIMWEGSRTLLDDALNHLAAALYPGTGSETADELAAVDAQIKARLRRNVHRAIVRSARESWSKSRFDDELVTIGLAYEPAS